ncbi:hypothetical protein [Flavobacterium sp.]|jgi:hypothetical protein|uniref:hypothetical protein n=1 Tax=Flavobacterium sp. TaxID=239 RepID=UPI0037C05DA1
MILRFWSTRDLVLKITDLIDDVSKLKKEVPKDFELIKKKQEAIHLLYKEIKRRKLVLEQALLQKEIDEEELKQLKPVKGWSLFIFLMLDQLKKSWDKKQRQTA